MANRPNGSQGIKESPELRYCKPFLATKRSVLNQKLRLPPQVHQWLIKDLSSGKMIGSAKECDGPYFLRDISSSSQSPPLEKVSSSTVSNFELILWHKCLGHPSFPYLKAL
ncbi:uncharacterized protein LOC112503547 [Cynara cardunculus var. scolymus]|uniref:uncharacterized protein LOC112503547 n=1 Tax=Cynara cardunculus var. scolymus TaxID=59895 RepID=UPI000D62D746|nr:uncharacterized protein LOC112503547 [Cynara cardunculus var. scolymus]